MLNLTGSRKRLCNGVTRRDLLHIGGIGALGLSTAGTMRADSARTKGPDASAKACIFVFLFGSPPQHETFDPKPLAPAEIRGDFGPIATKVPGLQICEHLPKIASIADRLTVIRSMSHPFNIHSAAYTLTGIDQVDIPMETNSRDSRHWPCFGSVLDYLAQRGNPTAPPPEIPRNLGLPFRFSSRLGGNGRGGPYGGFLGRAYDTVWTEFQGTATHEFPRWQGNADKVVADPYGGIRPDGKFVMSKAAQLGEQMTLDRLHARRSLLDQLSDEQQRLHKAVDSGGLDRHREMAFALITSEKIRNALDVDRESMATRERYGMTLFGQATLAGRRLLEAGAPLVSVFWDEYNSVNSSWDTHFDHYDRLKNELLPGLDSALTSLIVDLEERGMLDDTLVMCLTEHGRTPKLTLNARGVGREHWSETYCNVLAGGGIARGRVIGASDSQGAFVKDQPISPKDVLATLYHLVGIDHEQTIPDRLGRPLPLVVKGEVIKAALA